MGLFPSPLHMRFSLCSRRTASRCALNYNYFIKASTLLRRRKQHSRLIVSRSKTGNKLQLEVMHRMEALCLLPNCKNHRLMLSFFLTLTQQNNTPLRSQCLPTVAARAVNFYFSIFSRHFRNKP